ncbi:MAG: ROK family protein [Rhodospirillaceae bacterium]|nr:ROK family protein [Rhodospirillaceae bacterium]
MVKPDLGQRPLSAAMWTLGIDIGATAIKLAVVNQFAATCYENSRPTLAADGLTSFLANLRKHIDRALSEARRHGANVSAIGIGVPGLVQRNRIVGGINNIPILADVSLDDELAELGLPIEVENDAYLMGMAESRFGAALGVADVIFLTVGTGIGAALKLNGRFYRGANGRSSEIGHMILSHGGARCTCGNRGCLEVLASTPALIKRYLDLADPDLVAAGSPPTGPELVRRYLAGEPPARAAFHFHFEYLAAGVASLINIFDPRQVVIGGGISESGDFYVREVRQRVAKSVMNSSNANTTIDKAGLGNRAGCIGAACLFTETAAHARAGSAAS